MPAASTFATKVEADRWLAHKRTELDRGAVIDEQAGSQPLAHWWPGYLRSLSGLIGSTVKNYEIAWRLRVERHTLTISPLRSDDPYRTLELRYWTSGMLGIRVIQCRPRDPEAMGLVERANGYLETSLPRPSLRVTGRFQHPDPARYLLLSRSEHRRPQMPAFS